MYQDPHLTFCFVATDTQSWCVYPIAAELFQTDKNEKSHNTLIFTFFFALSFFPLLLYYDLTCYVTQQSTTTTITCTLNRCTSQITKIIS